MKLFARLIGLCALILLPAFSLEAGLDDGRLDIYWIDVEGGGATLIVTPAGESILIDTGNPGGRDAGRIHKTATQVAGLKQLDHVLITHFHIDHFGGAAELSRLMPIQTLWDKGLPDTNPDNNPQDTRWPLLSKPYRELEARERKVIQPGQQMPLRQPAKRVPLSLRCVAARQSFIVAKDAPSNLVQCRKREERPQDTSDNANSVAVVLELGAFRFFDGGDMTWNTEAALVCPINRVGEVDVYQVNHHGLDQSNNPVLVRSLAPTVAVMNNGARKGTAPATMATLKSAPSLKALFQVHKNVREGADETNTEEDHIANLEADCQADIIQLSVAPDGKSYRVSVPSRNHENQFQTRENKLVPKW